MKKDLKKSGFPKFSLLFLSVFTLLVICLNSCQCPECKCPDKNGSGVGPTGTTGHTGTAQGDGGGPGCGPIFISGTVKEINTNTNLNGTVTCWENTDGQLNIGGGCTAATGVFNGCECNCSAASAVVIASCANHWNEGIILPTFIANVTADQLPLRPTPKTTNPGGIKLTVNVQHTGSLTGYTIDVAPSIAGHSELRQSLVGAATSQSFILDAAVNHYTISVYDPHGVLVGFPVSFTTDKILASGDTKATMTHNYAF